MDVFMTIVLPNIWVNVCQFFSTKRHNNLENVVFLCIDTEVVLRKRMTTYIDHSGGAVCKIVCPASGRLGVRIPAATDINCKNR